MPINPPFSPCRAPGMVFETDLARARRMLSSSTSFKRLSSDDAEIIARIIAHGIAEGRREGLELAEGECEGSTDVKNHLEALKDGNGVKS